MTELMSLTARMRGCLGMVLPIWFPDRVRGEEMRAFLRRTLEDVELYANPSHVALVVDGCPPAEGPAQAAAAEVRERTGIDCVGLVTAENEGKGGAVAHGLRTLMEESAVSHLVVRDCDGDHDVHDTVRLFRRAVEVGEREGTDRLFVVGSRPYPHMALGWARGEYERLLNQLTVEACNAVLAAEGRWVDLRYSLAGATYPDFQSGFKLYTRATAEGVIEATRQAHEREPEAETKRWGGEFVTVTELLVQGAIPVEASRVTYDQQPQTTFDESDRVHAFGRQFVWLFRRLGTPSAVARTLTDNALARSPLRHASGMWDELLALREYVRERVYPSDDWGPPPERGVLR